MDQIHNDDLVLTHLLVQGNNRTFKTTRLNIQSLWISHMHPKFIKVIGAYLSKLVQFKIISYFLHEGTKRRYIDHLKLFAASLYGSEAKKHDTSRIPEYHTEAGLVEALNDGDKNAFEIIYRRHAKDLFRHIQRNVTSYEDCEEILQDVFEGIWKNHQKIKPGSIWGYLYTVTSRKVLLYFRKNKIRRNYEQHFRLFEAVCDYLPEEEKDKTITPEALENLLQTGLAELPERYQEAFKLRLNENLSNTEIAERMNIKKVTVENYMVKTLSHLRNKRDDLLNTFSS